MGYSRFLPNGKYPSFAHLPPPLSPESAIYNEAALIDRTSLVCNLLNHSLPINQSFSWWTVPPGLRHPLPLERLWEDANN